MTSSLAEILSSDSKEVVSVLGKVVEVCKMVASQVVESAAPFNFNTHFSEGREG